MTRDSQLLLRYTKESSEDAFGELVSHYLDLVYTTALRQVGGDAHLAKDISQTVFAALARKAAVLPKEIVLGGWLYRHTCFVARQSMRTEQRRRLREQIAVQLNALNSEPEQGWEHLAPALDRAMLRLGQHDREAILLRYFERRDFRAVGLALGISQDAARMRVSRALEKLRKRITQRGLNLSTAGLASLLAAHAVTAAPCGLAPFVAGAALAGLNCTGTGIGTGIGYAAIKLMTMAKLKLGMGSALIMAALVTPIVLQHQSLTKLRGENSNLRRQAPQVAQLQAEVARLRRLQPDPDELDRSRAQHLELLRLRRAVAQLRREAQSHHSASDTSPQAEPGTRIEPVTGRTVPRESWANVGTDTPETAVETLFWTFLGWERTDESIMHPGINAIVSLGGLENPALFDKSIGTLLLGDPNRIAALRIEPARVASNKASVEFTLTLDDGSTRPGLVNLEHTDGRWGATIYGRGEGESVELSFTNSFNGAGSE